MDQPEFILQWFKEFIQFNHSSCPVLVIENGHCSRISMEVIKLAQQNQIHLLCLLSHTSHILQPLDVGVFKSLKSHFNKACRDFFYHPRHVIRSEDFSGLLAEAWPKAVTPVNIMKGFKHCGIIFSTKSRCHLLD